MSAGSLSTAPDVSDDLRPRGAEQMPADIEQRWPGLRILGSKIPLGRYLREMWAHREFAATGPLGQLEASNQNTVLGRGWNLLHPLLLIGIYYLIFGVILRIESRRGVDDYLPFLTIGVISYNFTRASMHAGALSIVKNRGLMQTLYFPRTLLPLTAVIATAISHLYAVAAMLIMLVVFGVRPSVGWITLPIVLLLHAMLNFGLAFFTARFTFHFRDFEKFLTYILRLLLYVSGVLIPINDEVITHPLLLRTLELNPVYALIEMTRQVLLVDPIDPRLWAYGAICSVVVLLSGFSYYRRAENDYSRV